MCRFCHGFISYIIIKICWLIKIHKFFKPHQLFNFRKVYDIVWDGSSISILRYFRTFFVLKSFKKELTPKIPSRGQLVAQRRCCAYLRSISCWKCCSGGVDPSSASPCDHRGWRSIACSSSCYMFSTVRLKLYVIAERLRCIRKLVYLLEGTWNNRKLPTPG